MINNNSATKKVEKHNRLGSKYIELVDIENLHKSLKEEAVYKTPDLQ